MRARSGDRLLAVNADKEDISDSSQDGFGEHICTVIGQRIEPDGSPLRGIFAPYKHTGKEAAEES